MINPKCYKIEIYILIENAVLFNTNHNILLKLDFSNEKVTKLFQSFFEFLKLLPKNYFNAINRKSKKAQDIDLELVSCGVTELGFVQTIQKNIFLNIDTLCKNNYNAKGLRNNKCRAMANRSKALKVNQRFCL